MRVVPTWMNVDPPKLGLTKDQADSNRFRLKLTQIDLSPNQLSSTMVIWIDSTRPDLDWVKTDQVLIGPRLT